MPFEKKTNDYKTHKHEYNVYVELNSKTKMGKDLLNQYHEQTEKHYMDIGRIGYHNKYGQYIIDEYTKKELVVLPKLIIRVTERAIDRAGKDVYQLRTFMSKFGQINFLLTVDKDKADLILVENVYIENLNHREDYETLIWRLTYYNQKPVPLKEIFYKVGIKANPEDYGKAWKEEEVEIKNVLVSKVKAEMTKDIANKIASEINQKALVTSLNYLNNEGEYGKKITKSYSQKVANNQEINKLATSPKLENTLNHILVKTLEEETTKKDLKNDFNFDVYKKILDVQLSCPNQIKQEVEEVNNKQSLKEFLVNSYQKPKQAKAFEDEEVLNNQKQDDFERIINFKYDKKSKKEDILVDENIFDPNNKMITEKTVDYRDFEGNKINVDLETDRFFEPEKAEKKKQREKDEKLAEKTEKKNLKEKSKEKKNLKPVDAECNVDEEFEKSKMVIGLNPEDAKKKKKKRQNKLLFKNSKEEKERLKREEKLNKKQEKEEEKKKKKNLFNTMVQPVEPKQDQKTEPDNKIEPLNKVVLRPKLKQEEEDNNKKKAFKAMLSTIKTQKEQEEEEERKKANRLAQLRVEEQEEEERKKRQNTALNSAFEDTNVQTDNGIQINNNIQTEPTIQTNQNFSQEPKSYTPPTQGGDGGFTLQ